MEVYAVVSSTSVEVSVKNTTCDARIGRLGIVGAMAATFVDVVVVDRGTVVVLLVSGVEVLVVVGIVVVVDVDVVVLVVGDVIEPSAS